MNWAKFAPLRSLLQYLTRYMKSAEHDEIYSSLIKAGIIEPFSMNDVDGAHPKSRKYWEMLNLISCCVKRLVYSKHRVLVDFFFGYVNLSAGSGPFGDQWRFFPSLFLETYNLPVVSLLSYKTGNW